MRSETEAHTVVPTRLDRSCRGTVFGKACEAPHDELCRSGRTDTTQPTERWAKSYSKIATRDFRHIRCVSRSALSVMTLGVENNAPMRAENLRYPAPSLLH